MGNFVPSAPTRLLVHPLLMRYRKVTHAAVCESSDILKDAYEGQYMLDENAFVELFSHWMGESVFLFKTRPFFPSFWVSNFFILSSARGILLSLALLRSWLSVSLNSSFRVTHLCVLAFSCWCTGETEPHYQFWLTSKSNVDAFEVLCGLIIFAQGTMDGKVCVCVRAPPCCFSAIAIPHSSVGQWLSPVLLIS